jgi:hypothetical protein
MTEHEIIPLFSVPIYKRKFDIPPLDLNWVDFKDNTRNQIGQNFDILSDERLLLLKHIVLDVTTDYFYNVLHSDPKIEIYITDSWLNRTYKGRAHHQHRHPNSVLSGVLYLEGDYFSTTFHTPNPSFFMYKHLENTHLNAEIFHVNCSKNEVIVFPSKAQHEVLEYTGETPRITLSWNTFIRGKINEWGAERLTL